MQELRIGMVGSGMMGKVHTIALQNVPKLFDAMSVVPRLYVLADINAELAESAARRLGYERGVVGWERVLEDPSVDAVYIVTPNNVHKDVAVSAAQAGKHIMCEKPLGMNAAEAEEMYRAAEQAGVKHMVGFNYRKNPAILEAARLIREGVIGEIRHFRGILMQDWAIDPEAPLSWRFQAAVAGSGALGDLASHVVDCARFLVGEIVEVVAMSDTYIRERPLLAGAYDKMGSKTRRGQAVPKGKVDVDDAVAFLTRFDNGAMGSIWASRYAGGRKVQLAFEVNGSQGSIYFDHQRMNEMQLYLTDDPTGLDGYKTVIVGPRFPYVTDVVTIPVAGQGYGYMETEIIHNYEFLDAITSGKTPEPNFHDGWKACQVTDAVIQSAGTKSWVGIPA